MSFKIKLVRLCGKISDLMFAKRCPCCGRVISPDADICKYCFGYIRRANDICSVCGEPKKKCLCSKRKFLYSGFVAPFYNEGSAKQAIYALKFRRRKYAVRMFVTEMAKRFQSTFPDVKPDFITSVPSNGNYKDKLRYDQAGFIARRLAVRMDIPFKKNILIKIAANKTQHELSGYEQRVKNVEGAYAVNRDLSGAVVLLVDDIKTTGATFNECAKQLLLAGADSVYCIAAVITEKKHPSEKNKQQRR